MGKKHALKNGISYGTLTRRFARVTALTALFVLALVLIFPMIFTVSDSFMSEDEIAESYPVSNNADSMADNSDKASFNFKIIPEQVTLTQYYDVLVKNTQFLYLFWNSIKLTLPIVLGQVLIGSMAAYAFSVIRFKWREPLFFIYILVMMMPFQVTLVPNFIIASKLGLINSYLSIILPGIFNTFGVFLLRQYMSYIPFSYIEAAKVEGAGHIRIFLKIIVPECKNGIAALSILSFVDNWNMVEQPLIFLNDSLKEPLSIYLSKISQGQVGLAFAASAFYMLPVLLIFLYGIKYLMEGIQLSGTKM